MRLCFISASFVREREILKSLNKRVELLFVCPYRDNGNYSREELISFCAENKIKLLINDFTGRRSRSLKGIKVDRATINEIRSFSPDVLYIEAWGSPYFAILCRIHFGKKSSVIAIMDYKLHQRQKGKHKFSERFYRFIQLKFYSRFQFFSISQEKYFINDHKDKTSYVIRLFVVDAEIPKIEIARIEDKVRFLFFGRIFFYKGVDLLLEAVNLLSEKRDDFVVTIAGNAENWEKDYNSLIRTNKNLNLQIRYIPKEELSDLFSDADFFVAPYREVTQSGPLLRAYNFDLIPITSNEEGFTEYVEDGTNGLVFRSGSATDLARVLEHSIDMSLEEKKAILSNIRKLKSTEFNIESVTEKYIQMFEDIIH